MRALFDRKIDLDDLRRARADCAIKSVLVNCVTDKESLKKEFDKVIWQLYLGSSD